jgi:hypothetical protein
VAALRLKTQTLAMGSESSGNALYQNGEGQAIAVSAGKWMPKTTGESLSTALAHIVI